VPRKRTETQMAGADEPPVLGDPDPGQDAGRFRRYRFLIFEELGVFSATFVLIVIISVFHPGFINVGSITAILGEAALIAIIAFGMVFLLSMRELDLSVGSILAMTVVAPAILMAHGVNPWLAAATGLIIGGLLGAVNGVLVALLNVPTIIVTLGTLSMYSGLVLTISGGNQISGIPVNSSFFNVVGGSVFHVPFSVVTVVILGIVCHILYRHTRFGILVRAIGANPKAAAASGIPIALNRLLALVLVGTLCGVSGALTLGYFQAADPTVGTGLELQVIAAAIIGGTALSGGSGTIFGAFLGALLIEVISSGLAEFQVPANWSTFVTGAVIIVAVALDNIVRRQRRAAAERARGGSQ
jgi:ribose transport system permease protein